MHKYAEARLGPCRTARDRCRRQRREHRTPPEPLPALAQPVPRFRGQDPAFALSVSGQAGTASACRAGTTSATAGRVRPGSSSAPAAPSQADAGGDDAGDVEAAHERGVHAVEQLLSCRPRRRVADGGQRGGDRVLRGRDDVGRAALWNEVVRQVVGVEAGEDAAQHRHAERAADFAGRVVDGGSDACLGRGQDAQDRLGGGRGGESEAQPHQHHLPDDAVVGHERGRQRDPPERRAEQEQPGGDDGAGSDAGRRATTPATEPMAMVIATGRIRTPVDSVP